MVKINRIISISLEVAEILKNITNVSSYIENLVLADQRKGISDVINTDFKIPVKKTLCIFCGKKTNIIDGNCQICKKKLPDWLQKKKAPHTPKEKN